MDPPPRFDGIPSVRDPVCGNVLRVVRNVSISSCLALPVALTGAGLAASLLASACTSAQPGPRDLGAMPDVVTTAVPEWIPWSIRAGKPVDPDPR